MEQIINSLFTIDIWAIGKIMVLIGLFVYVFFSFIVVRQVKLMTEVVSGILSGFLNFLAWFFFLFSVLVFILTLLFL